MCHTVWACALTASLHSVHGQLPSAGMLLAKSFFYIHASQLCEGILLPLVADLLTLCFAGTGSGGRSYDQGYGQDSTTGEQCAIRSRPAPKAPTARPHSVYGQLPPAGMLLAKSFLYIHASQLACS